MSQSPRRRVNSSSACCSSRRIVQPVGLPGELMKIARVLASHAAINRARSRRHPPASVGTSATARASPPSTVTASAMLGQTGDRITMLSPVSISACAISMMPLIAEEVTMTRSAATGMA